MSAASDKRVAELEAQIAERDERIAVLESQLAQYAGTTRPMVREIAPANSFVMPTMPQFNALLCIVYAAHPKFTPKPGHEQALREQTYAAFAYLGTVSRTGLGAFSRYANDTWTDRCGEWCRDRGLARDMCMSAFTVALLMHGDMAHTLNIPQWPYDFHIGIEAGGRLPKGDGWQRVLQTSRLLAPSRVSRQRAPEPPVTRIVGGNAAVGRGPRLPEAC